MDVKRRARWALIIACFALTLKIITFASPYWAVIEIHFPIERNEEILETEDILEKGVSQKLPFEIGTIIVGKKLTVFLGLWYFVACIDDIKQPLFEIKNVHQENNVCLHSTFETSMNDDTKASPYGPILRGTLQKMAVIQKFGLSEYRIEVSIAIFLSIMGLVTLFIYKRTAEQRLNMGRMAFIFFLVAGTLFCVTTGKISTDLVHVQEMINLYYGGTMYGIHIPVPWCLIVGGLAAVLSLVVSGIILGALTRHHNEGANLDDIMYHTKRADAMNAQTTPILAILHLDAVDFPLFPETDTLPNKLRLPYT